MRKKLLLWAVGGLCLLPLLMVLRGSLFWEGGLSLRQYGVILLQTPRFMRGFWNSVCYTGLILLVNVPLSLLAAYGFTRFRFRGRTPLFWLYIVMILLPFQATVVPQYMVLKALGLLDTVWAVLLPNFFATFGTFLMVQYLQNFDQSLYEAAEIDGMGTFRMLTGLVLPVCRPLVSAMAMISFLNYWSLMEQPIMFLKNAAQQPLSVVLNGAVFGQASYGAGVVFSLLPLLIYFYAYEDLQTGMGLSSGHGMQKPGEQKEKPKKKKAGKRLLWFGLFMVACTLLTQKISNIMTPQVSVYSVSRPAPVLDKYPMVVPLACVTQGRDGPQLLKIAPSTYDGTSWQAVSVSVEVEQEEGAYCAVTVLGVLEPGSRVICHSTKPVAEGDLVQVMGEAFYEEEN